MLDGNFTAQPIKTGESEIVKASRIDLNKLRSVSHGEMKDEFGIEFYPSPFDGYSVSSQPYPYLYGIAPITVGYPYSVVSLYDSKGDFTNDFDRATDRPSALLTEYAVTVNDTTLAALQAQGIYPTYGGRYGTVITQRVTSGTVKDAIVVVITEAMMMTTETMTITIEIATRGQSPRSGRSPRASLVLAFASPRTQPTHPREALASRRSRATHP